jgi:AhpD family alkylhydroperoxidase
MERPNGGPVPRTYRVRELFSDLLSVVARSPSLLSIWLTRRLSPAMREKIIVAVAQANACRMCEHAHTRMALEAGVTDAELAALERMDETSLDRHTWLALAYARERTREDFSPHFDQEQRAALERELGRQTVLDVENVARVMTVANRIANSLNALSDRRRGRPIPGSRLGDELIINVLFLPGAWLGTLIAAVRQRKSPFAVWRDARGTS